MTPESASSFAVRELDRPATELAAMTFPAYRHLLELERAARHPEQGDDRLVDPVAVVAWSGDQARGMALAELPVERDRPAELLSVFVDPEHRRQGIAGALVAGIEEVAARAGFDRMVAVYTSGTAAGDAVERLFARRRWGAPEPRTLSVRFTPEAGLAAPLFEPTRMEVIARGLEIFPWSEVTSEELDEIRRSDQRHPWIEPNLAPWRFLGAGYDRSSVAARYKGRIVGWVINHRSAPDIVRFTCSFMHRGLSRRGRILPLYRSSLERLPPACRLCTFVTPFSYPHMIRLIRKWMAPVAERVTETRGISKALAGGVSP